MSLLSQMSLREIIHLGRRIGGERGNRPQTAASVATAAAVWDCYGSAENVTAGVWAPARFPRKRRAPVLRGTDPGEAPSEAAGPIKQAGTSGHYDRPGTLDRLPRDAGGAASRGRTSGQVPPNKLPGATPRTDTVRRPDGAGDRGRVRRVGAWNSHYAGDSR